MEITLLVKSILGLIVILGLLIFLLVLPSKKKKKQIQIPKKTKGQKGSAPSEAEPTLESLRKVIKNKRSTEKELQEALEMVIKKYGTVHKKLGLRAHPDFDIYIDMLFTICRHPNTNKDIIVQFDRDLGRLNPEYKKEINEAITKGLNSRGV